MQNNISTIWVPYSLLKYRILHYFSRARSSSISLTVTETKIDRLYDKLTNA